MSELLEHLNQDTFPPEMVESFINWCVWEQAHPALLTILQKTGLHEQMQQLHSVDTVVGLARASERAGQTLHEARRHTGPLGLSTAEAAAFLTSKMARAATEAEWDPEGVAFFAAQVCGWAGFAEVGFTDFARKLVAEQNARHMQEQRIAALWRQRSSA